MSKRIFIITTGVLVVGTFSGGTQADEATGAIACPVPHDGIQAGLDAHAIGEARRRSAFERQLGWNEFFRARATLSRPGTYYYGSYVPYSAYGRYLGQGSPLDAPLLGYGVYGATLQPIGRRQLQVGPNRWESFPIYGEGDRVPLAPSIGPEVIPSRSPSPSLVEPKPKVPKSREF